MRAARNTENGIEVVDLPEPEGPGELVRIRSVSICGSDFGFMSAGSRFVMGHELAGLTESGQPVALEGIRGCGNCIQCGSGHYNRCPDMGNWAPGFNIDGGMADYFRAPTSTLVPLPLGLDLDNAALVEPTAVAWHGLRLAGVSPGARVGIVGGGAIGLLSVAVARRMGASAIGLDARHLSQREAGEKLGASAVSGTYDVVVEAAGTDSSVQRCVELCAPGGTVLILGSHHGMLAIPFLPAFMNEVRFVHALAYSHGGDERDSEAAARLLAEMPDIASAVITHRFPLEDAREAFRVAGDRASGAIKVVVHP